MFYVDPEKSDSINDWWNDLMPILAMEEAGEFIQAVSKAERERLKNGTRERVVEEMGDLVIAISALSKRYGIDEQEIQDRIDFKTEKEYAK